MNQQQLAKISTLAQTPRNITPALSSLALSPQAIPRLTGKLFLLGIVSLILGSLVVVGLALFKIVPWSYLGITVGFFALTYILDTIADKVFPEAVDSELQQKIAQAPLSLAAVVQGNSSLYDPNEASYGMAVLVYSTDSESRTNPEQISRVRDYLRSLREQSSFSSKAHEEIAHDLQNERGYFEDKKVPEDIAGNSNTFYTVHHLNAARLPGKHLSEQNDVFPVLIVPERGLTVVPAEAWN